MEKRRFPLIPLIAFSSLISAVSSEGSLLNYTVHDKNITDTKCLKATTSPTWSINSTITAAQTTKPASNLTEHQDVMINNTSESVNTTKAPVSSRNITVQTAKPASNFSSEHQDVMINNTSESVNTTKASGNINATDGSSRSSLNSTSGHSISSTTSFTFQSPKSYTDDTTLNPVSVTETSTAVYSGIGASEMTATPSQAPDSGLTLLAFGVMSLILILIVVMVILVTAINLRGRCRDTKQHEGIKSCDSVMSESNRTSNCEKESITLVSVRTINTDNNTDSPQISSVHSTIVDNEEQDLLSIKDGL